MEQHIIEKIKSRGGIYIEIENTTSLIKVYDLLMNNIIYEPKNMIENHYLGWYYYKIKTDYTLTKKYYLIGVENGYHISMYNLANYYKIII